MNQWIDQPAPAPTLTTFARVAAVATVVTGVTWGVLYNGAVLTRPVRICGFIVTLAGGWAGLAQVRITTGTGLTKLFPYGVQLVQNTEFTTATQYNFPYPVEIPVTSGFLLQFRSANAADGAGMTLTLNSLDIVELG